MSGEKNQNPERITTEQRILNDRMREIQERTRLAILEDDPNGLVFDEANDTERSHDDVIIESLRVNAVIDRRVREIPAEANAACEEHNVAVRIKQARAMELVLIMDNKNKQAFDDVISTLTLEEINYHWSMSNTPNATAVKDCTLLKYAAREAKWLYATEILLSKGADSIGFEFDKIIISDEILLLFFMMILFFIYCFFELVFFIVFIYLF